MNFNLKEVNFDELELHEIGIWPFPVRAVAIIGVCIATIVGSYFFMVNKQVKDYSFQQQKQIAIRNEYATKYNQAANLELYKEQMVEMKRTFNELLRQLPSEGQLPALMEDISLQAASAGLEFKLIRPGKPVDKGFYKELPIKMSITGSYHGLGQFISGLSKMQRIVTLHNFDINANQTEKGIDIGTSLTMDVEARTYWYTTTE